MNVAQSVSEEKLDQDGFFPKDDRDLGDAFEAENEGKDALGITITNHDPALDVDEARVGMGTQIYMLFDREIKNLKRDTMVRYKATLHYLRPLCSICSYPLPAHTATIFL